MKALFSLLLLGFLVLSCTSLKDREDNPQFAQLTEKFFTEYWDVHPSSASAEGLVQYDKILEIPSAKNREKKLAFYQKSLELFKSTSTEELSLSQIIDRELLINEMEKQIWYLQEFKEYQWDPSVYNIGSMVSKVLEKQNRPLEDRIQDLSEKLLKAPEYYQEAKNNIQNPTAEHTRYAIEQNKGVIEFLNKDLIEKIQNSKLSTRDKSTAKQRVKAASAAAQRYITFLRGVLARPKSVGGFRSFRLGSEVYATKFKYEMQIDLSPEELYKKALDTKEDIRSKMFETAIALYPKYYGEKLPPKDRQKVITNVLKKVSKKHTKPELFVETIRKHIPELTHFIQEKNLVYLDPSRPLKVRETPAYERGFAGASMDSPGPFDPKQDAFYNVTPLDAMSKREQESYLREYNDYTLQILNIHEALPGHYAQIALSNKSKSLVKAIFSNGATVEGWAVYAEKMMLEQGYGGGSEELQLMYYKWFLRVVTNTILDYEVHNKSLTKNQALKLMREEAFQENAEAKGKWHRATVSQVQLCSYFAGFSEIYKLRETIKQEEGSDFDLREFHDNFLSYGSAPIKDIKKMML